MFFKKKIGWLLGLITLSCFNPRVFADVSHDVAIKIAEIGRYHLETKVEINDGVNQIQRIEVAVLSNSNRQWNFVVVPSGDCSEVEWSRDKRVWYSFQSGAAAILTGSKSDWQIYSFYLRLNNNADSQLKLGYELLFNE